MKLLNYDPFTPSEQRKEMEMTQSQHAVRAARNRSLWGDWAAMQYLINRGVDMRLYRLARQLQAVS